MKASFVGRWRIVEMELRDQEFVDLVPPGHITFDRCSSICQGNVGLCFRKGCRKPILSPMLEANQVMFGGSGPQCLL
jgi:hypothetical protein